jgi:hypothetical protein
MLLCFTNILQKKLVTEGVLENHGSTMYKKINNLWLEGVWLEGVHYMAHSQLCFCNLMQSKV